MGNVWMILYGTAAGFAFGGLLASLHDLVTGRQLGFAFDGKAGALEALLGMLLRLAAGPYLLVRSTLERYKAGRTDPLWIALLLALACTWGCLSGVLVVDLLAGLVPGAAARG